MAALLASLLAAAPAHADGVYGTLQLQYQRSESPVVTFDRAGDTRLERTTRELWLRTLDMHNQSYLRSDLLFDANLRFSETSYFGRTDQTRTPQGVLRLIHPYFQLTASHQPSTTRVSTAPLTTPAAADTGKVQTTETRNIETMLIGHFAPPRGPQLDASWMKRSRDGSGLGDQSIQRNARVAYERERWSAYGSLGDQTQRGRFGAARTGSQGLLGAGGQFRFPVRRGIASSVSYDVNQVRSDVLGGTRNTSRSQSAGLNSSWQANPKLLGSLTYQWRRADALARTNTSQTDQEGAMLFRWTPQRLSSVTTGGGVRTARNNGQAGLQKYLTAVGASQGDLRRGWNVTGTLSHTTTWDPQRAGSYGVQTAATSTRMRLSRMANFDGNFQITANGDTAAREQRYALGWATRLQVQPLRSLTLTGALRAQRVGPGLLRPSGASRGRSLDVLWRLNAKADVLASYAANGLLPGNGQRTSSKSATARYAPTARWQYQFQWTRADQSSAASVNGLAPSHETINSQVQYQPTRRVAASVNYSVSDPGQAQRTRRFDAAFTWSFGR